jgi:hypothetical protein
MITFRQAFDIVKKSKVKGTNKTSIVGWRLPTGMRIETKTTAHVATLEKLGLDNVMLYSVRIVKDGVYSIMSRNNDVLRLLNDELSELSLRQSPRHLLIVDIAGRYDEHRKDGAYSNARSYSTDLKDYLDNGIKGVLSA